jgi:rod shape-determining protein MreD
VDRRRLTTVGRVALLLVIALALQVMLTSRVTVLGVTADIFLIVTVVVAISRGSLEGAVFGFLVGILADTTYMQFPGLRSLVYVLTGYFVGMLVLRFETVNPWGVLLLAAGASLFAQLVYGLAMYVMGPRAGFFTLVWTQMLPETVLDGLVTVPVYLLLVRLRVIGAARRESAIAGSRPE